MKKVLIVEDTKQLADLYKHRLEKEYQVMILPDGDKVLWSVLDILNHSHRKIWYSKILENI